MSEFSSILPGDRNRVDYGGVPSEQEFFAKIAQREATIHSLRQNTEAIPGIGPVPPGTQYRLDLINRLDRQSPFERYLMTVWENVQTAGWATGEKFRLSKLFGTSDDWQIAFLMAKATFEKAEAEKVRKAYAGGDGVVDGFVNQNIGNVGGAGAVRIGGAGARGASL